MLLAHEFLVAFEVANVVEYINNILIYCLSKYINLKYNNVRSQFLRYVNTGSELQNNVLCTACFTHCIQYSFCWRKVLNLWDLFWFVLICFHNLLFVWVKHWHMHSLTVKILLHGRNIETNLNVGCVVCLMQEYVSLC